MTPLNRLRALLVLCATFGHALLAQTATVSGEFSVEPATLVSLGFEWKISGDDNRNATVEASYRKKGEQQWRDALPLMRLQREEIGTAPGPGAANADARYPLFRYTAANMFAGSILNLDPDTEYECRFVLSDPDGVTGRQGKDGHACAPEPSLSPPQAATCFTSIQWTGQGRSRSLRSRA